MAIVTPKESEASDEKRPTAHKWKVFTFHPCISKTITKAVVHSYDVMLLPIKTMN